MFQLSQGNFDTIIKGSDWFIGLLLNMLLFCNPHCLQMVARLLRFTRNIQNENWSSDTTWRPVSKFDLVLAFMLWLTVSHHRTKRLNKRDWRDIPKFLNSSCLDERRNGEMTCCATKMVWASFAGKIMNNLPDPLVPRLRSKNLYRTFG